MKEHVSLTFLSKEYSLGERITIRARCISGGAMVVVVGGGGWCAVVGST